MVWEPAGNEHVVSREHTPVVQLGSSPMKHCASRAGQQQQQQGVHRETLQDRVVEVQPWEENLLLAPVQIHRVKPKGHLQLQPGFQRHNHHIQPSDMHPGRFHLRSMTLSDVQL